MNISEWSGDGWTVSVTGAEMTLTHAPGSVAIASADAARLEVRRRWFRWSLCNDGQRLVGLRGITRTEADALSRAVRRLALAPVIADALAWHAAVAKVLAEARTEQRWIPAETAGRLAAARPGSRLLDRIRAAGCEPSLTAGQLEAVAFLDADLDAVIAHANEQIMASELSSRRSFFDTIEKTPLTDEQARAVVCFDNRVQVLAAAGSGKTSVMVARAAYAVSRGFVAPDRILLLAFNKAAAAELQERVAARFAAAGIDSSGLRAATFHSFGLEVIGRATGAKPRLARWLDQGEDVAMVLRIVDELRDASESFRYHWDLYRLLFANVPADLTENEPDGYDHATRQTGYRTFAGEVVKSHGERLIANFLYLNGVDYVYERPYDVDVSDSTHSQYRPDFYYPGIDVWHEHWALGRDGKPPSKFEGYAESMAWKRQVHAQHGTRLAGVHVGGGHVRRRPDPARERTDAARADVRLEPRSPCQRRAGQAHEARGSRAARPDLHDARQIELMDSRRPRTPARGRPGPSRRLPDPAVPGAVLADPRPVAEAARRRTQRRLRGHAGPGGRPPRSRDRRRRLRPDHGRRVPGRQPGPRPPRPRPGAAPRPVPDGGRRRLAVHQPIRRGRPVGDDGLRGLVRPGTPAGADDHLPVPADGLRRRPGLRVGQPRPVQQADAVGAPRSRPAHHRYPGG